MARDAPHGGETASTDGDLRNVHRSCRGLDAAAARLAMAMDMADDPGRAMPTPQHGAAVPQPRGPADAAGEHTPVAGLRAGADPAGLQTGGHVPNSLKEPPYFGERPSEFA